jgi:RNA-directed DNA polymerase
VLNHTNKGVSFLGYRLLPDIVRLNQTSKKRFLRKINAYQKYLQQGRWSQSDFARHVEPLVAFTEYAQTKQLRTKVICDEV